MLVLYLVFTFGVRSPPATGAPFSVHLISGMIAWLFLTENLQSMANVIRQHGFLIKKLNFRLSILPVVKLLSSLLPHIAFILFALIVASANGIYPSVYSLQVIYYLLAMMSLLLGMGWLTSSTNLFVTDVSKFVAIICQLGFWVTPIFWNIEKIPQDYQWILKLNPAYYIVTGYRDSLIYQVPFWSKPWETAYYWVITLVFAGIGMVVFRRLRPHFAEVV